MHDIVKRGGRVLVIDPRRTETAAQFEWLGIVPDGDAYLLLSLLHVLFGREPRRPRAAGPAGRRRRLAGAAGRAVQPGGHRVAHRHRPGHRADAGPRSGPHADARPSTAASAPAPAKTARSQRICSTRSTWWRAISTCPAAACSADSAFPGERWLNKAGGALLRTIYCAQAIADRRLPVGADVRACRGDGQGDHHPWARSDQGAGRQRGQPGAVGAQRRRTRRRDAKPGAEGRHRSLRQRDRSRTATTCCPRPPCTSATTSRWRSRRCSPPRSAKPPRPSSRRSVQARAEWEIIDDLTRRLWRRTPGLTAIWRRSRKIIGAVRCLGCPAAARRRRDPARRRRRPVRAAARRADLLPAGRRPSARHGAGARTCATGVLADTVVYRGRRMRLRHQRDRRRSRRAVATPRARRLSAAADRHA